MLFCIIKIKWFFFFNVLQIGLHRNFPHSVKSWPLFDSRLVYLIIWYHSMSTMSLGKLACSIHEPWLVNCFGLWGTHNWTINTWWGATALALPECVTLIMRDVIYEESGSYAYGVNTKDPGFQGDVNFRLECLHPPDTNGISWHLRHYLGRPKKAAHGWLCALLPAATTPTVESLALSSQALVLVLLFSGDNSSESSLGCSWAWMFSCTSDLLTLQIY